jgi:tRNA threonylcarbamoyladenosine biosynthesis protein TsaB
VTVLGIETSTAVCSVGLYRDGVPALEQSIQETHIHSEKLLTLIERVVQTSGIELRQLDAIAVSIGPGSFTGLRIGLSTAKGFAYSLDKPIVVVPTFDAIAESGRQWHPDVKFIVVVLDAKKDEWYVGEYRGLDGRVEAVSAVAVKPLDAVIGGLKNDPSTLVLTDNVAKVRSRAGGAVGVEDVHPYCRGGVVAALGAQRAAAGNFADVRSLEPLYLKDFVIRTTAPIS